MLGNPLSFIHTDNTKSRQNNQTYESPLDKSLVRCKDRHPQTWFQCIHKCVERGGAYRRSPRHGRCGHYSLAGAWSRPGDAHRTVDTCSVPLQLASRSCTDTRPVVNLVTDHIHQPLIQVFLGHVGNIVLYITSLWITCMRSQGTNVHPNESRSAGRLTCGPPPRRWQCTLSSREAWSRSAEPLLAAVVPITPACSTLWSPRSWGGPPGPETNQAKKGNPGI